MHPIEHLRYLARADSADAAGLVAETATALGALRGDHATLVVAARRIVERHPTVGPLWWLCAHMLVSDDPRERAWELADEVAADATSVALVAALPLGSRVLMGGFDPIVADALADRPDVCATSFVVGESARRAVRRANRFGVAVEAVDTVALGQGAAGADIVLVSLAAGTPGVALVPPEAAIVARAGSNAGKPVWLVTPIGACLPRRYVDAIREVAGHQVTELDLSAVARVAGPSGVRDDVATALAPSAPMAPELLRAVGTR